MPIFNLRMLESPGLTFLKGKKLRTNAHALHRTHPRNARSSAILAVVYVTKVAWFHSRLKNCWKTGVEGGELARIEPVYVALKVVEATP